MFKPILITEEDIGIPIYNSDQYFYLTWNAGESITDVFKKHTQFGDKSLYTTLYSKPLGEESGEYSDFELCVYDFICSRHKCHFYLITKNEIFEFEDLYNSVAVYYNELNIIEFYKNHLLPFCGKPYIYGD